MSPSPSKSCPMCKSDIHPDARKCPNCQHFQNRLTLLLYHPVTPMTIYALVFLTLFATIGQLFSQTFPEGVPFDPSKNQLQITNTELLFGETKNANTVAILGSLQNNTDTTWHEIQFHAQFADSNGKVTDAAQRSEYRLTVPARQTIPFKISIIREFPTNAYTNPRVQILSAKDTRTRF